MTPVLGPVEARLVLDLAGLPSLRLEHTLRWTRKPPINRYVKTAIN